MEKNMKIYEELQARGLLAQLTDPAEIRDLVNDGKATFYIGFDPTADSLHVGHFMALLLMKRLQEAGNQMSRFIEFGEGKAMMVNNADWLRDLNYIEFLRDIGSCFSVNEMLRARCYEQRMEKGLSFLEFNYMTSGATCWPAQS